VDPLVKGKVASVAKALAQAKKLLSNVPPETIAIVLSAQHSLEDNWALYELGKLLGTTAVFFSRASDGYEDKILIHKDKNSNTRGVHELAPDAKTFVELAKGIESGSIKHAIALGGMTPSGEADQDVWKKLDVLVAVAAHESATTRSASVVLPATSWAEQSGTYVNAKGHKQVADRALAPQGASENGHKLIGDLAKALGVEPSWSKLKDIRQKLGSPDPKPELMPTTSTQAV